MAQAELHDVFTEQYWGTPQPIDIDKAQKMPKFRHILQASSLCTTAGMAILAGHPGEELAEGTVLGGPIDAPNAIQPNTVILCDTEGIGPAHPTHRGIADQETDDTVEPWKRRSMTPEDIDLTAPELFARNTQLGSGSRQDPTIVQPYYKSLYSAANDTVYTRKINLAILFANKHGENVGIEIYKWGKRKSGIFCDDPARIGRDIISFLPPYAVGMSYDTGITDNSKPHVIRVRSAYLCLRGLQASSE